MSVTPEQRAANDERVANDIRMMPPFQSTRRLESAMNRLTDLDGGWWPFLYLRPPKNKSMDNRALAKMAFHYGLPFGAVLILVYAYIGFAELSALNALLYVVDSWLFFFVTYKYTFAICWNLRAERLRGEEKTR